MIRKSTTTAKRISNYRLLYLAGLPVACTLMGGSRLNSDNTARAAETTTPPAPTVLTGGTTVAASAAPSDASAPLSTALTLAMTPHPNSAAVDAGEAEYKLPLPCPPPADRIKHHPLEGYIAYIRAGKSTETRDWVLPLLIKGLAIPVREARITGYSSRDSDGGGCTTRWGTHTRWGICAADPAYWGPGTVIWMGDPVNQVLVVEDTGSAIKGKDRFDVCVGDDRASSERMGCRHANYVPIYAAPPRSSWGDKPDDWRPPAPH